MYVGFESVPIICALASFALACRAIGQACFARHFDGVTGRVALLWAAACVVLAVVVPSLDGFAGSPQAAATSTLILLFVAFLAWWLGRRWREQAMQREAERFAAARYYALKGDKTSELAGGIVDASATNLAGGTNRAGAACPAVASSASNPSGPEILPGASDFDILCARAARSFDLTRREEEVLLLLIQGKTAAEVADDLVVSPNTVKTHIRNLYRKLGINRREDLSLRLDCTKNDDFRTFCSNH